MDPNMVPCNTEVDRIVVSIVSRQIAQFYGVSKSNQSEQYCQSPDLGCLPHTRTV